MLYNTKWDKPKHLTLVQWLNTQPDDKEYSYTNGGKCAYAQYLRSQGIKATVSPYRWVGLVWGFIPWSGSIKSDVEDALQSFPHTMGALRQRLL
jgi:hypothetical protein